MGDMNSGTYKAIEALLNADETVQASRREAVLDALTELPHSVDAGEKRPLLLNQAEAARLLRVSRITVFRMVKDKQIIPVMVRGAVRYRRDELECIARGERGAP